MIVWGSVWPDEWSACVRVIEKTVNVQHVVAPHKLHKSFLLRIQKHFAKELVCYSDCVNEGMAESMDTFRVLLLDNVGMLARVYRYGDIAYVGGGKRGKLHNILEPIAYGVPVVFWDHSAHVAFPEAEALRHSGIARSVRNYTELKVAIDGWLPHDDERKKASQAATTFMANEVGATQKIYNFLKRVYPLSDVPHKK